MTEAIARGEQTFPTKLHACLTDLEAKGLQHIASFQPHGRSFQVHNQHLFVESVITTWFRQTKYSSFQRQLNLYGFQRITSGPDKHGYYHPFFLRGRPELVHRIPRMGIKGTGPRKAAPLDSQPNFYTMTPLIGAAPSGLKANDDSSRANGTSGTGQTEPRLTLESLVSTSGHHVLSELQTRYSNPMPPMAHTATQGLSTLLSQSLLRSNQGLPASMHSLSEQNALRLAHTLRQQQIAQERSLDQRWLAQMASRSTMARLTMPSLQVNPPEAAHHAPSIATLAGLIMEQEARKRQVRNMVQARLDSARSFTH